MAESQLPQGWATMSIHNRLTRLEAHAPAPAQADTWASEPATIEEALDEIVAHLRYKWDWCRKGQITHVDNLCRGPMRNQPDPTGRWIWATWQPDRPPGELPTRRDLFIRYLKDPDLVWPNCWETIPLPADTDGIDDNTDVISVWSGLPLCSLWEWRIFKELLEEVPEEELLAIEPKHRPEDWDYRSNQFVARSAWARYTPEPEEDESDPAWI